MVLQKLVQQHRKNLPYLGSQMNKPGYLDEVKSLISEFMQYDIREEELQDMLGKTGEDSLLHMKMQDVGVLYQAFLQYLEGHYMTGEGVMDALKKAIPFSDKLKKSVLLLDGFTGFLPALIPLRSQVQNVPAGPLRLLVSVLLPDLRPVARLVFLHGAPLERLKLCLVAHKLIPFF